MTAHSQLSSPQILSILAPYGITELNSYTLLSGGSENSNYLINSLDSKYVLTICEQKSLQKSRQLAALLNYLAAQQFHTSTLVKNLAGQDISLYNGKAVILKNFIEGSILNAIDAPLLFSLGAQLATLHSLKAPDYLPKNVSYNYSNFSQVRAYAANSNFYAWLVNTSQYIQSYISQDLPKSIIHSDIFTDNIIVSQDKQSAIIMDFEEACFYYRVFDIGMMIVGTCCDNGQLSLTKARSLIRGYQQNVILNDLERSALQAFTVYGATATAFWRHQNYQHINPEPSMFEHYLAMKNIAEQVLAIAKDQFVTEIFSP
ncbi:MAG: hypothetical protein OFPII_22560 [Osedax symbiont Rs1]|nr:MAG: hypothetical protein OFPII_22560 [Osedax symbiont Rs1]